MDEPIGVPNPFAVFWELFPRQRRGNKDKATRAFWNACARATVTEIMDGLKAYAASSEVANGYAKGAAAWLNDDRWANDYTPPKKHLSGELYRKFKAEPAWSRSTDMNKYIADYETQELTSNASRR